MSHSDCSGDTPFCYAGQCDSCQECHYCLDGVDGTCGPCGDGFPLYENTCGTDGIGYTNSNILVAYRFYQKCFLDEAIPIVRLCAFPSGLAMDGVIMELFIM